jgi:hypothetical protein
MPPRLLRNIRNSLRDGSQPQLTIEINDSSSGRRSLPVDAWYYRRRWSIDCPSFLVEPARILPMKLALWTLLGAAILYLLARLIRSRFFPKDRE